MADISVEQFVSTSQDPPVRGFLHRPDAPNHQGLVLTHGAGGNAKMSLLVSLGETFAAAGYTVLRIDLPFRQDKSFGPPRPTGAMRDRAGLRNAVSEMRKLVSGRVFLCGQSYGGRQATMLCAEDSKLADGLLLTSYPLHPPGKPNQLRVEHFPNLQVPALFISGNKDPFGSIEELSSALKLIPAKTKFVPVEGVGHDLGFRGKSKSGDAIGKILVEFQSLFG